MSDLTSTYRRIVAQLGELEALAADDAVVAMRAPRVSAWSVAQQLDHLAIVNLQVDGQIAKALAEAPTPGRRLKLIGRLALLSGWIPRGIGKAPEASRPRETEPAELRDRLAACRAAIAAWRDQLPAIERAAARRKHPRFGWLRPAEWLRFVALHNHHHLKIVRDIRRAAGA